MYLEMGRVIGVAWVIYHVGQRRGYWVRGQRLRDDSGNGIATAPPSAKYRLQPAQPQLKPRQASFVLIVK